MPAQCQTGCGIVGTQVIDFRGGPDSGNFVLPGNPFKQVCRLSFCCRHIPAGTVAVAGDPPERCGFCQCGHLPPVQLSTGAKILCAGKDMAGTGGGDTFGSRLPQSLD